MTAAELAEVCERHGIIMAANQTRVSSIRWSAWHKDDVNTVYSGEHMDIAVAALLKARWGITTAHVPTRQNPDRWYARNVDDETWPHPTELAAVVALADRLAQGGA